MIRKLVIFITGLVLLGVVFAAVALSGAIYDAGSKLTVDTFFFQPLNLSSQRVDAPEDPAQMGETRIRDILIKKYVSEYFYVHPGMADIAARMQQGSPMYYLSTPDVFSQWKSGEAQNIQRLAEKNAFRTATVVGEILKPADSDYYVAEYELHTWGRPNDMSAAPVVTRGRLHLALQYESGIRESLLRRGIHRHLAGGGDPAVMFKFRVTAVK